jgi:hypothetical protein
MGISSSTQLCNNALLRLGQATITSFSDGTLISDACQDLYDVTRQSLIRQSLWNFAIKRASLSASLTAPPFEYLTQYPLPNDYLRMEHIFQQMGAYKIEGNMILTNAGSQGITIPNGALEIVYVADITDTTAFDSLFVDLLTLRMAILLAPRVCAPGLDISALQTEFKEIYTEAKLVDSQDDTPADLIIDSITHSRYSTGWNLSRFDWN